MGQEDGYRQQQNNGRGKQKQGCRKSPGCKAVLQERCQQTNAEPYACGNESRCCVCLSVRKYRKKAAHDDAEGCSCRARGQENAHGDGQHGGRVRYRAYGKACQHEEDAAKKYKARRFAYGQKAENRLHESKKQLPQGNDEADSCVGQSPLSHYGWQHDAKVVPESCTNGIQKRAAQCAQDKGGSPTFLFFHGLAPCSGEHRAGALSQGILQGACLTGLRLAS